MKMNVNVVRLRQQHTYRYPSTGSESQPPAPLLLTSRQSRYLVRWRDTRMTLPLKAPLNISEFFVIYY